MILMIDNYDSFTYNLVQLVIAAGAEVEVVRNDEREAAELLELRPAGIIISPGPGLPENAGVCVELLRLRPEVAILGVCLGHQALGVAFGARVARADDIMHGKTSPVRHRSQGVFDGLPNPFEATRYHSLEVRPGSLPEVLEPTAWTGDGIVMGMRHRELPYQGVQFHPESVLTEAGPKLIDNFLRACGEDIAARTAGAQAGGHR